MTVGDIFCLRGDGCFSKVWLGSPLEDGCLPLEGRLRACVLSVWLSGIFPLRGLEHIISKPQHSHSAFELLEKKP